MVDLTLPELTKHRALVTGASDGIGLRIATRLALAGADVVLPVRNAEKGRRAQAIIADAAPGARVSVASLDLASLESISRFAEQLVSEGEPLTLMVNNAGVMTPPHRQTTVDGLELQLGTNHVGHVALVAQILPLLRVGGARITSQVSVAAARGSINWDDPNWERTYDGMRAYRQSKIALGLFGLELERRSSAGAWGVTSNLSHPGVAPTSLLAARPEIGRSGDTAGVKVIRWLSRHGIMVGTADTAALPALLAATSGEEGKLYGPAGPGHMGGRPAEQRLFAPLVSIDDARRAWDLSESLARVSFPTA